MTSTAAVRLIATCPDCGTTLSAGACPACSLSQLLDGSGVLNWKDEDEECEMAPPAKLEAMDEQFGRYRLKRKLAAGGMGVIYVAEDQKLRRVVALKMIRGSMFADESDQARFTIEAEAAAALDHPHIVPIYEVGQFSGQPFFTMKLIEGCTLADRLDASGKVTMAPREAAALLAKVARAVHHAHQRGVLHRDLKPGNILIDEAGEPWLTDFGLAKRADADSALTQTIDHLGTPHYMSPEVADGKSSQVSTASDVWALGVILWEMVSGKLPFRGFGSMEILRKIVDDDPQWPPQVKAAPDLVTIARRCLEKDPARRLESAGAVADELDRWLRGEPILARPVSGTERFLKWVRRKPAVAALCVVVIAGLVSASLLWRKAEYAVIQLTDTNGLLGDALRVSTATKLAGQARLQVEDNPSRALLLAVESVSFTENTEFGVLPESASALTSVLQEIGGTDVSVSGVKDLYDDGFPLMGWWTPMCTLVSPDNRWLVSLDFSGLKNRGVEAALFDLKDRDGDAPVRKWMLWPEPIGREPAVRWLADSRRLLAVNGDASVTVWNVLENLEAGGAPPAEAKGKLARDGLNLDAILLSLAPCSAEPRGVLTWTDGKGEDATAFYEYIDFSGDTVKNGKLKPAGPLYSTVTDFHLSPDGRLLLVKGSDRSVEVTVYDLERPDSLPFMLPGGPVTVRGVCMNNDSSRIALRLKGGELRLFDVTWGAEGMSVSKGVDLSAQPGGVERADFSPDGKWLAATYLNGTVALFPLREGLEPAILHQRPGKMSPVRFSPDSAWLACGGEGRVISVWKMKEIHSGAPPQLFRGMPAAVLGLQFSGDSRWLLATGNMGTVIRKWHVHDGGAGAMPAYHPAGNWQVKNLAVSPDSQWIAAACHGKAAEEGYVMLSEADGEGSVVLGTHGHSASGVAFSTDGRWLASTGHDGTVKVWDVRACLLESRGSMEDMRDRKGGGKAFVPWFTLPMDNTRLTFDRRVAFHPRGTLYAVCGDGILFEWDLTEADPAAGVKLTQVHSIKYLNPDIRVSPDGKWLAIARHGWDSQTEENPEFWNQVHLYDVSSPGPPVLRHRLQATFIGETHLDFSPDSRWLAAGSNGVSPRLWDLQAPDIAASMREAPVRAQVIAGTAFSPDGRWLAMGGNDGLLHLWDWQRPNQLRTIQTGTCISALAWLKDGRLAAGGASNLVAVWDMDVNRQKALAGRLAGRRLSAEELTRFRVVKRE